MEGSSAVERDDRRTVGWVGTIGWPPPGPLGTESPPCILPVISVNHPLDYEQVVNGVIYLTVMAKDAGNPPLNSTVPVTIEVFVSTMQTR